eukprot:5652202-Pyramimonas_sp.AAC.1
MDEMMAHAKQLKHRGDAAEKKSLPAARHYLLSAALFMRSAAAVEAAGEQILRAAQIFGQTADLLEYSAKAAIDYITKVK